MSGLIETLNEQLDKRLDKVYGGDNVLKTVAKTVLYEYDDETANAVKEKIKQIKLDEYDLIKNIYDATYDASLNFIPAKSGLEFWNNQPQIIINGIYYNDVNEYKPEQIKINTEY